MVKFNFRAVELIFIILYSHESRLMFEYPPAPDLGKAKAMGIVGATVLFRTQRRVDV
jgi:hypothetical protein